MVSAHQALGPIARILLRSSHVLLGMATDQYMFWERKFKINMAVAAELRLLYQELPKINGQAIILGKTGVTLASLLKMAENKSEFWGYPIKDEPKLPFKMEGTTNEIFSPPLTNENIFEIMASDASDFQEYSYSLIDPSLVFIKELEYPFFSFL